VKKTKKKRQYPPQSPKPPLSSSLTTQHKHLLTFHILFLLSLFSFSDQNRTPNQPRNSKKKKTTKTTKTKVRCKEKKEEKKDAEFFILGFRGCKFSAEDRNARPRSCDDAVATTSGSQTNKTSATQETTQNTKQIRISFPRSLPLPDKHTLRNTILEAFG